MPSSGPLLIADVPWLLYRSFFALPKSIVGAEGQPVNALLGTVNALLAVIDARPHAAARRRRPASAPSRRPTASSCTRPITPTATRCRRAGVAVAAAPALLASLGWPVAGSETLEADDVMFSYARAERRPAVARC